MVTVSSSPVPTSAPPAAAPPPAADPGAPGRGPAGATPAPTTVATRLGVAVLIGLLAAEALRHGGFWPVDALGVAIVSMVLLAVRLTTQKTDRWVLVAVAALVALALWWLARAIDTHTGSSFLPFGASVLGFGAAFAVVQPLPDPWKRQLATVVGWIGALVALVGCIGLTVRWYPMAMSAQHLWRLASVLTYSDAAGLVLVLVLLVALGLDETRWSTRAVVCLCLAGAVASQSRGALIALVCGLPLIPLVRYRRLAVPLLAGLAVGVVAVGTSFRTGPAPEVGLAVIVALAVSIGVTPPRRSGVGRLAWSPRTRVVVAVALVLIAGSAAFLLRDEIGIRALSPSDQDRSVEWSAALRQFESAPLAGVGPDRLLTFQSSDGTWAHFAHNEYLQVAADGGVIGVALLALAAVAVAATVRRRSDLSSCAVGALVAFAVGGAFDFDWHLPFIAMVGGCVAGFASQHTSSSQPARSSQPTRESA